MADRPAESALDALAQQLVTQRKKRLYLGLGLMLLLAAALIAFLLTSPKPDALLGSKVDSVEAGLDTLDHVVDRWKDTTRTVQRILQQIETRTDERFDEQAARLDALERQDSARPIVGDGSDVGGRLDDLAAADRTLAEQLRSMERQLAGHGHPEVALDSLYARLDALAARLARIEERLDDLADTAPRRTSVVLERSRTSLPALGLKVIPGRLSDNVLRDFRITALADDATVFQAPVTINEAIEFVHDGCRFILHMRRAQKRPLARDLLEVHVERLACDD